MQVVKDVRGFGSHCSTKTLGAFSTLLESIHAVKRLDSFFVVVACAMLEYNFSSTDQGFGQA